MMGIFENLIRLLSSEAIQEEVEGARKNTEAKKKPVKKPTGKYDSDILALQDKYGDLNGQDIKVYLQDLLVICPRNRRRIEAYQGLVNVLDRDYGCHLNIISRKTKK